MLITWNSNLLDCCSWHPSYNSQPTSIEHLALEEESKQVCTFFRFSVSQIILLKNLPIVLVMWNFARKSLSDLGPVAHSMTIWTYDRNESVLAPLRISMLAFSISIILINLLNWFADTKMCYAMLCLRTYVWRRIKTTCINVVGTLYWSSIIKLLAMPVIWGLISRGGLKPLKCTKIYSVHHWSCT